MKASRLMSIWLKLKSLGPYLLIELLLPGGTLIALLLWVSQQLRPPLQVEEKAPDRGTLVAVRALVQRRSI